MVYGAIDLHLRYSEIRVIDEAGHVVREARVVTTPERLVAALGGLGPGRVLLESGTESEWVAQALEAEGYAVIVADPNFAPMYGERQRKIKTDRRDVAALAEANRRGWYRPAYRVSAAQRASRQLLTARRQLVQMRTGTISVVRALLRQWGYRAGTGGREAFGARVSRLAVPASLAATLAPLLRTLTALSAEIRQLDTAVDQIAGTDPVVRRLQTVPGVGPVVALSFRAFVDDVRRFPSAAQLSAAVGLVPREASSAERRHRGHLTKAGPSELRSLLVQAGWVCWRSCRRGPLRHWTDQLAARRGKRIAVVALARRLSRILYAIWRDETVFEGSRVAA
jgi:transposase